MISSCWGTEPRSSYSITSSRVLSSDVTLKHGGRWPQKRVVGCLTEELTGTAHCSQVSPIV